MMAPSMVARIQARIGWLVAVLVIALALAATWKLTLGNRIIARGDLLLYFYPLRDYASAALRAFHLPLWNPYTFMGAPFLANSQVGFFYPPNVLTAWVPVGHAVSWNIAFHLAFAAFGMFVLARAGLRLGPIAALTCAVSFGLGGYLGAQVEHLNQFQVLAWLPWQVALVMPLPSTRKRLWLRAMLLPLTVAMQILAGHTQSLYICLVTLTVISLTIFVVRLAFEWRTRRVSQPSHTFLIKLVPSLLVPVGLLLLAVALGGLLSAVQLAPTVELATQSARSGGLPYNEVGSFSWRPWVVARALLPTYGDPLFAEYVAYVGATGLALALLGIVSLLKPTQPSAMSSFPRGQMALYRPVPIILGILGVLLALGIATPLFNVLYHFLPGFNLFRAQARWLIMFALGAAMLVGYGTQALVDRLERRHLRTWLLTWFGLSLCVVLAVLLSARFSPEPEYRGLPAAPVLAGWGIAWAITTLAIVITSAWSPMNRYGAALFALLLCVELLISSQFQPYARASDDEALTGLRPATAHLLADRALDSNNQAEGDSQRILALSGLFFDPGDLPEQTLIYGNQLSADELYDRIIASKQKEVLSPNLSLYYRLPSVDGYDGGLLPLRSYTNFVRQFLPAPAQPNKPAPTSDGRLREQLTGVPADQWLARMAVKYVVTDKTHDVFLNNIYYDLQFGQPISSVIHLPLDAFDATSLGLILSAPGYHPGDLLLHASLSISSTAKVLGPFDIRAADTVTNPTFSASIRWDHGVSPSQLTLTPTVAGVSLLGMTSIDNTSGTFQQQPIRGQYDMGLVHSGDVKIYANKHPAPRVFIASLAECSTVNGQLQVDTSATDMPAGSNNTVTILDDQPERLAMQVHAQVPGWLVVRDAYYPGWVARIDGSQVPISIADIMFRAIQVMPGTHDVIFTYEPTSLRVGIALSGLGLVLWLLILLAGLSLRMRHKTTS